MISDLKNSVDTKWMNSCIKNFLILLFLISLKSCANKEKIDMRLPAMELYQSAIIAAENKFYEEAIKNYEILVNDYSGTRLGTLSHLMMGNLYFKQSKWVKSESSYRNFLLQNPRSNLIPYVLNRLIALNYERNQYGLFIKSRDYDRNMEPNRSIIREYQRFYLLFPKSPYLAEVKKYYKSALSDLAEHELHVANFYFDFGVYHSSINRYLYLLKNYPNFKRRNYVAERLIKAYQLNQQPYLAEEMKKILNSLKERKLLAQMKK